MRALRGSEAAAAADALTRGAALSLFSAATAFRQREVCAFRCAFAFHRFG
jgi:hypothetical protein